MRFRLPTYIETRDASPVDAYLARDGFLIPLSLDSSPDSLPVSPFAVSLLDAATQESITHLSRVTRAVEDVETGRGEPFSLRPVDDEAVAPLRRALSANPPPPAPSRFDIEALDRLIADLDARALRKPKPI